jgi:hypothetical protein
MKQYWRIGTIRALLSLVMGMFVLGRGYYIHIPFLADLGLVGALILGSFLTLLFLGIGWLYDEKGRMWSPKLQANAERNPYQYISNYKSMAYDYQTFFAVISTIRKLFEHLSMDTRDLDDIAFHIDAFFNRKATRADVFSAEPHAEEFNRRHPFVEGMEPKKKRIPIATRLKLGFETEILRLNWIQSLTGLFQDVLVFGALYVTILFPSQVTNGLVPLDYLILGILFLSLPLFFILTLAGWYYDKKLRVWSADYVVKFERNPYMFVPDPRNGVMEIPFYTTLFRSFLELFRKLGLEESGLESMLDFLNRYMILDVSDDNNMKKAKSLRRELDIKF